jgi:leucyl aminopeptidase
MTQITVRTKKEYEGIRIRAAVAPAEITPYTPGKAVGEIRFNPAEQTVSVSLGKKETINLETFRRAGGALTKWLAKNQITEAAIETAGFADFALAPEQIAFAFTEGLLLASFRFDSHKSKKDERVSVVLNFLDESLQQIIEQATIICEATNLARAWASEPANVINPVSLALRAQELAAEVGLKCTVLDDKQLAEMGAGAIVAVGQGSATPSRLIVLEYQPPAANGAAPVVLVGKAITFDTGGYSIKNSDFMFGMKYDKCGGMAALGAILAAARLKINTPVVAILAAAENMISAVAYRPNDIIKTLSGKTVEISNTDAEGRLVLCDALTYAQTQFKPRSLIDLATLTDVILALGTTRAGLFSNHEELGQALWDVGERVHERLWRLPLDEDYFELVQSDDADLKNLTMGRAHPIVGGMFLKQFIQAETPWVHLDIAGVAVHWGEMPYASKGASGFGVRLLVEYLQGLE